MMWSAAMWGAVSGSAVFVGAILAMVFHLSGKMIGYVMAFGTGVLIGAAAYELLGDYVEKGEILSVSIGFMIGAITFTLLNSYISKRGAGERKRSGSQGEGGFSIFIGTVMDAIPESIMIGASLLAGPSVSWMLVAAIFISNIPEGLSSTTGLKKGGYPAWKIYVLWIAVILISALASFCGYVFLSAAPESIMGGIAAFAAGGIIAMVSSTMMPEAYENSGPSTGLITAFGLLLSLILDYFSG